jgi:hypothetical protein
MASIFFTGCLPALSKVSRTFRFVVADCAKWVDVVAECRLDGCRLRPSI